MIGFLRGRLVAKQPPTLLIDVNGVGYEVEAPMSTCLDLPEVGTDVHLITHFVVREDQHTLYGFKSEAERQLFRDLLKVNRVGAKLALGIMSGITIEGFVQAVQQEDLATLSRLPGVGKKTAERLILDMRDRLEQHVEVVSLTKLGKAAVTRADGPRQEAFTALTSLGYKPAEAQRMLAGIEGDDASTEDILRQVLQSAAPVSAGRSS